MKVLCVTPCFPSHPEDRIGSYVLDSIKSLIELNVEIHVLVVSTWKPWIKKIDFSQYPMIKNIQQIFYFSIPRHYCRPLSNSIMMHTVYRAIKKMHIKNHYDLVHVHTELCALPAIKVKEILKVPVVATIHGIDTCERMWKGYSGKLIFSSLEKCDKIIMVGSPLVRYFSSKMKSDHFVTVYNGFRSREFLDSTSLKFRDEKRIKIVSVSNLVEGKGIDINIKALSRLKKIGLTNWHYTIVGGGDQRSILECLVTQLALDDFVTFVGYCDHDKVYQYLESADVFSLPSYREAFGIAYLEAMAMGVLTIGVYSQGAEAFIKNGETGLMMQPKSVESLSEIFREIFSYPEDMKKIAINGKNFVIKNFTWACHGRNLLEVYRGLV